MIAAGDRITGVRHANLDSRECRCGCQRIVGLPGLVVEVSAEAEVVVAEFSVPSLTGGEPTMQMAAFSLDEVAAATTVPVLLQGGPAHGATVEVSDSRIPLLVEGHGVPDGYVARYRPRDARRRVNEAFRFDGLTEIVACLQTAVA